jgi:hypothetical protein
MSRLNLGGMLTKIPRLIIGRCRHVGFSSDECDAQPLHRGRAAGLIKDTLRFVDVAPRPGGRRDGAHNRMLRLMEVFGRVLARRGIATADVAARLAFAQSNPKSSLGETLFACARSFLRREILYAQSFQMIT